jgi:hypothetical protein
MSWEGLKGWWVGGLVVERAGGIGRGREGARGRGWEGEREKRVDLIVSPHATRCKREVVVVHGAVSRFGEDLID